MKILFLSQYFTPEPVLKGMSFVQEMIRQGHEVQVLTGFPNYPGGKLYRGYKLRLFQRENMEGVDILRLPLYPSHSGSAFGRIINFVSFALSAAIIGPLLVRKPDVVYVCHGNATVGLPAYFISKVHKVPFVLDIQDLWPDTIASSGMMPVRFLFLLNMVNRWCNFIYKKSSKIAVLSPGIKPVLVARGVPDDKISVIRNWCDENSLHSSSSFCPEEPLLKSKFNIVMAGNIGKMQALDVVVESALILQGIEPNVQFVLVGKGTERERLIRKVEELKLKNVLFLPWRPIHEIGSLLNRADVLFVHLKDDPLFEITIPSRIQAYLALGKPVLCGVNGDASQLVEEIQAGVCFKSGDPRALAEGVRAFVSMSTEKRDEMGRKASEYYKNSLNIRVGTKCFLDLFSKAICGTKTGSDHSPINELERGNG